MKQSHKARVAIVGAGVAGLSAAWRLQSAGHQVQVFEKGAAVGGRTLSVRRDGFVFDVGAITLAPTYTEVRKLIGELGISDRLHKVDLTIGIPRNGRVHVFDPARPLRSLLGTKLLSTRAKFRFLKLARPIRDVKSVSSYRTLSTLVPWDHETTSAFVMRELGDEIHGYFAGPFIRGNLLTDLDTGPSGEFLWVMQAYSAPYVYALDGGINLLAETLAQRISVSLNAEVHRVERRGAGVVVEGVHADCLFQDAFDACVIAIPPPELLKIAPLKAFQRQFFESVRPSHTVSVHLGLRRRPKIEQTFILPPRSEQPHLVNIILDHLKGPGRAPQGKGVITLLTHNDWAVENMHRSDEELREAVLAMALPWTGDLRDDVEVSLVQRWRYANVLSEPGFYRRLGQYEANIDPVDRVQIAGDFHANGMEAAVISGTVIAERLRQAFAAA